MTNAAYSSGFNTVYFRPAASSGFTVTASSTDADSSIKAGNAGYTFSSLTGNNFAITQTGGQASYTFGATATQPGSNPNVFANNNASTPSPTAAYALKSDTTAPTGGALTVNGTAASGEGTTSFETGANFSIGARTDYTETQTATVSGLGSSTLVRDQSALPGMSAVAPCLSGHDRRRPDAGRRRRHRLRQLLSLHADRHRQRRQQRPDQDDREGRHGRTGDDDHGQPGLSERICRVVQDDGAAFTLTATDPTSGVATRLYKIDSGTTQTYTAAVSIPNGSHTISYWSQDNAGNVESTQTTATINVDAAVPVNVLALAPSPTGAFLSGTTLYYKSNAVGSFALVNDVSDADSGPASSTFPVVATTGWTHGAETVSTPSGGPFTSSTWSWTASPSNPSAKSVTSVDVAGNPSAATSITFVSDVAGPTGGALTVNAVAASGAGTTSLDKDGSFTIARTEYTIDAGSGADTSVLTVQTATLAADGTTCGSFGSSTTIVGAPAQSGLAEGCYRYTLTGTDRVGNTSSMSTTVKVDKTTPTLTLLQMFDVDGNGKVDQVKATFSETLAAYTAGNAPWSLASVPSNGVLHVGGGGGVSVSGSVATLDIDDGPGAANTAVGSFTVALATNANGIRDAAGNLVSFGAMGPADEAGPAIVSTTSTTGTTANRMEAGDTLDMVFSEPLAPGSVPASATVTELRSSGTSLTIPGVIQSATIANGYVNGNGAGGSATGTITLTNADKTIHIVLGTVTPVGGGVATGSAGAALRPVAALTDTGGNGASTTFAATCSPLF